MGTEIDPPARRTQRLAAPLRASLARPESGRQLTPDGRPETVIDELLRAADEHRADFPGPHSVIPERHVAIVTCMDSRIDIFAIFGLRSGEAHLIRNAGGLVTDDVLRSLIISQRVLQTREVIIMHHTNCGLHGMDERAMRERIRTETGSEPPYAFGAFEDLGAAVRSAVAKVRAHAFLPHRDNVRGFIYDVDTGAVLRVL